MSGLIPIVARAASSGAVKKVAQRVVAGIAGAGAKTVNPVYRNIETGGGGVKIVKPADKNIASRVQKEINQKSTNETANYKSGSNAAKQAKYQERVNSEVNKVFGKDKPLKINSNPMRGK